MSSNSKDSNSVAALVRKEVMAMKAYHNPSAEGMIKLDAMESPYQLPAKLKQQWLKRICEVEVNRYPDSQCDSLKSKLRARFKITDDANEPATEIVLGNGSDELIQMIMLLVGGVGRTILAPTPAFSMYPLIATNTATEFIGVPLRDDFSLDGDALLKAIQQHQPACVFLAYPNNPSGNCFDEALVKEVLANAPGIVVIDEAYFAFCERSFLSSMAQFPNLMILRTLSKSGMAALRLGMLIAHPQWAMQLEKIRLPYNINSLTQCSAEFYLDNYDAIQEQAKQIVVQRDAMFARLEELPGVYAYPSEANFILFKLEKDAQQIDACLKKQGILIKNLHQPSTPLENCLRVTIGSESENKQFIDALQQCIKSA